jgi:hypothetical protein
VSEGEYWSCPRPEISTDSALPMLLLEISMQ